ncbi:hypothetical protein P3S67_027672 [Capsicum chacoense]
MSSFNPLTSILDQNKLEVPNYVDWKHNLDIVLTAGSFKFVLVEECPIKSAELTDDDTNSYDKWVKVDEMTRCYILASMKNVLQHQHQSMTTAYDMLESLKEMFREKNRSTKQTAMKDLLTMKMVEGTSVREHVLKMTSLLNEVKILGTVIDKESQVKMVLQTLPNSFQQFCLNYNMNKMNLSLAKLLNKLQVAESIIKQQASPAMLMVDKPSFLTSKLKSERKKKKKPHKVSGANGGVAKPEGKCYHFRQPSDY